MQQQEFGNLMDGKSAKWADLKAFTGKELQDILLNKNISVEEKRQKIEKQEIEIPLAIRSQIDKFMEEQRKLGVKNRTIRRMVKRKFNIAVI